MKIKISEIKHIASLIVAIEYGQLWRVDMEGGEATLITDLESDHKDFFVMLTGSSWAVVSEEDTLGPCNLSGDQTVKRWDLKKKEWREHHCATMQLGQRGRGDVVLAELEGGELIRLRTHEGVILAEVTRWRYATDTEQRSIDAREEWRPR